MLDDLHIYKTKFAKYAFSCAFVRSQSLTSERAVGAVEYAFVKFLLNSPFRSMGLAPVYHSIISRSRAQVSAMIFTFWKVYF